MEPSKRVRYFVMNHQNQPLELHLAAGVVVLDSMREQELQEADLQNAQLEVFQKHRLVSIREVVEADSPVEPAKKGSPKSSAVASRETAKKQGAA